MQTTARQVVIADPQIACDFFPAMPAPRSPRQQRADGYMAFCNLEDISVLTTLIEVEGYNQALRDCADILTEIHLAKQVRQ